MRRLLGRCRLLDRTDVHVLHAREVQCDWPTLVGHGRARAREVRAGMMVIDTIGRLAGIPGDAENTAGAAITAMRPLEGAAADGLSIVALQHARKGGGEPDEAGRGSSAWGGAADIIVSLTRCGAAHPDTVREIRSVSRYEETPDRVLIDLDEETHEYRVLGDTAHVATDRARAALLQELGDRQEHRETALYRLEGISRTTVQRVLSDLEHEHVAERLGRPHSRTDPTRWRLLSESVAHAPTTRGPLRREGENGRGPLTTPLSEWPTPSPVGAGHSDGPLASYGSRPHLEILEADIEDDAYFAALAEEVDR
jgi:hypothetical protein